CAVPSLAAVYRSIADEEAEHATLAFRTLRFLVARDPRAAETALVLAQGVALPVATDDDCERLGVLSARTQGDVHARAMREVVLPVLREVTGLFTAAS
ncbi:MAG: hypothetical protein ABI175_28575, partial [Polyangiales bacterium]